MAYLLAIKAKSSESTDAKASHAKKHTRQRPTSAVSINLKRNDERNNCPSHNQNAKDAPDFLTTLHGEMGRGEQLEPNMQSYFERLWNTDLQHTCLHRGPTAEKLNNTVDALAFTVGQDIFFSQQSQDLSAEGWSGLVAHELAHVAQNHGMPSEPQIDSNTTEVEISEHHDPAERKADQAAHSALSGQSTTQPGVSNKGDGAVKISRVDPAASTIIAAGSSGVGWTAAQWAYINAVHSAAVSAGSASAGSGLATAPTVAATVPGASVAGSGLGAGAILPVALAGAAGLGTGWAIGEHVIDPYLNRAKTEDSTDHGASFTPGEAYNSNADKPWYLF